MSSIRLYVPQPLSPDATIEVSASQAHYLGSVMRRAVGNTVRLFNGQDGEWACRIGAMARAKATLTAGRLLRAQAAAKQVEIRAMREFAAEEIRISHDPAEGFKRLHLIFCHVLIRPLPKLLATPDYLRLPESSSAVTLKMRNGTFSRIRRRKVW